MFTPSGESERTKIDAPSSLKSVRAVADAEPFAQSIAMFSPERSESMLFLM